MGTYRVETSDGTFEVEVDDSSGDGQSQDNSALDLAIGGTVGGFGGGIEPKDALSVLMSGASGLSQGTLRNVMENPLATSIGGPSLANMKGGARSTIDIENLLRSGVNRVAGTSLNQISTEGLNPEQDIFPKAETSKGQLAQLAMENLLPSAIGDIGAWKARNTNIKPDLPKSSDVSGAVSKVEQGAGEAEKFLRTSNKLGADVIDNMAAQKVAGLDADLVKTDEALSKNAYELSKRFRDEYYPKYNEKLSKDFGEAWDGVVKGVEVEAPDISFAFSDFGKKSGLYNKAQYAPETLLPVEKKILNFMNGVQERISSEAVNRMKLEDLSTGFEDILRGEYGKQWKTPILDKFRKSFVDLAGDSKYAEMKAVKADFKPKYQFREDMRKFFGRKKGEADMQSAVNLFKNWAGGELQTKNPSHAEIIRKITQEFGDNVLDSISNISKDRADLSAMRQAVIAKAEADKNSYASHLLAKVSDVTKDKNEQVGLLNKLLADVEQRKQSGILKGLIEHAKTKAFSKVKKFV